MPTRTTLVVLFLTALLASPVPVAAQVINGESTYEDNFLHTPPAQNATDETRGAAPTDRSTTHLDPQQTDDRK